MNTIREVIGRHFGSPMQNLSFVHYFRYINEAGKITNRSLLELVMILLSFAEEQEKRNAQYEENFNEVHRILTKLIGEKKMNTKDEEKPLVEPEKGNVCEVCGKSFETKLALTGHSRSHKEK